MNHFKLQKKNFTLVFKIIPSYSIQLFFLLTLMASHSEHLYPLILSLGKEKLPTFLCLPLRPQRPASFLLQCLWQSPLHLVEDKHN